MTTERTENGPRESRPFLGIFFECCHVYGRIYPNHAGTHYAGHCPRCLASIRVRIGEGGTSRRIFTAR
ncbi:MAG: RNHCP domain-containing protein [Planctomycetota bacterium]